MTLPPFPAHLAKPMKEATLDSMHKLDNSAKSILLAYYTADHVHGGGRFHFDGGMRQLGMAAEALGYTLTPIPAPVQAPATAEALFEGAAV